MSKEETLTPILPAVLSSSFTIAEYSGLLTSENIGYAKAA